MRSNCSLLPLIQYIGADGSGYAPVMLATSPTQIHRRTSSCRAMARESASKLPWISATAPMSMGGVARRREACALHLLRRLRVGRRGHQQIRLVPDEVVLAVDGRLVVLAHEDRR